MRACVTVVALLAGCTDENTLISRKMDRILAGGSLGEPERALRAAETGWPPAVCNRRLRLTRTAERRRFVIECFRAEAPAVRREGDVWVITVFRELGRDGPEERAERRMFKLLGRGVDEVVVIDRWKAFVDGALVTLIDHPRLTHAVDRDALQTKRIDARELDDLAPYDLMMDDRRAVLAAKPPVRPL